MYLLKLNIWALLDHLFLYQQYLINFEVKLIPFLKYLWKLPISTYSWFRPSSSHSMS